MLVQEIVSSPETVQTRSGDHPASERVKGFFDGVNMPERDVDGSSL